MSEADKIAEFIAKRGVRRVAEQETNGYRNRDWCRAVRGELPLTEQRHLAAVDHCGREFWVNGLERIT